MKLEELNTAPAADVTGVLADLTCCPELAAAVVGRRPFPSAEAAAEAAGELFDGLSDDAVLASVNHHPPIGERTEAGSNSEEEQASVAATGEGPVAEIRRLNPEYRERFGHVFLICAAGLTGEEILAAMRGRMGNDPATEWRITREQLGAINRRRILGLLQD